MAKIHCMSNLGMQLFSSSSLLLLLLRVFLPTLLAFKTKGFSFQHLAHLNSIKIINYWMSLSMRAIIIIARVCVLRQITQTEALIIIAIMRKLNPVIILLCIFLTCTCKDKRTNSSMSLDEP